MIQIKNKEIKLQEICLYKYENVKMKIHYLTPEAETKKRYCIEEQMTEERYKELKTQID